MKKTISQEENGIEISIVVLDDNEIENITPKSTMGGVASTGKKLKKLSGSLDALAQTIATTCNGLESKIDKINEAQKRKTKISELNLEFGLSLTTSAGVVIGSVDAGATLKVSAKLKFD